VTLWIAFVLVHFWLGLLCLYSPGNPVGDVAVTYKFWVEHGLLSGQWVGIHLPWVYPIVALVPMLIAYAFGPVLYVSTWLSLVMVLDAAAFAVLMAFGRDRRVAPVAWWWLAFLVLLGSIGVGRIDAIAIPLALAGVVLLAAAPRLATVLIVLAAWIKVWPAALVVAAIVALRTRRTVFVSAALTSAIIVLVVVVLGGGAYVFSFITQLTGRGIEIEAPMAVFWMFDAARHAPGASTLFYDTRILAYEVDGPGIAVVGTVVTVLLAVVVVALLIVGALLVRRGITASRLLPPLALALTTAFLVFNKVGSPQYVTWLAVPIVLGLTASHTGAIRSFRVPAILGLIIAALTQWGYPFLFDQLLALGPGALLVVAARDALYVVLFVWAVRALLQLGVADDPELGWEGSTTSDRTRLEWLP
jgi:hypothetical protein